MSPHLDDNFNDPTDLGDKSAGFNVRAAYDAMPFNNFFRSDNPTEEEFTARQTMYDAYTVEFGTPFRVSHEWSRDVPNAGWGW